jgi:hypothetical protein
MEMKFSRFLVIIKSEEEECAVYPSEDGVNKYSEHIQKWAVFH